MAAFQLFMCHVFNLLGFLVFQLGLPLLSLSHSNAQCHCPGHGTSISVNTGSEHWDCPSVWPMLCFPSFTRGKTSKQHSSKDGRHHFHLKASEVHNQHCAESCGSLAWWASQLFEVQADPLEGGNLTGGHFTSSLQQITCLASKTLVQEQHFDLPLEESQTLPLSMHCGFTLALHSL